MFRFTTLNFAVHQDCDYTHVRRRVEHPNVASLPEIGNASCECRKAAVEVRAAMPPAWVQICVFVCNACNADHACVEHAWKYVCCCIFRRKVSRHAQMQQHCFDKSRQHIQECTMSHSRIHACATQTKSHVHAWGNCCSLHSTRMHSILPCGSAHDWKRGTVDLTAMNKQLN